MTNSYTIAKLAGLVILTGVGLSSSASAARNFCSFSSTTNWAIPATPGNAAATLRIIGRSIGSDCATAGVGYSIVNARGRVLFAKSYQAGTVATFTDVRSRTQMRAALADWIKPVNRANFHANLPNWVTAADGPVTQEFGFIPAETITRAAYLRVKADRTPMRCYVQGMESITCLIYRGGMIDPFGVQLFPG